MSNRLALLLVVVKLRVASAPELSSRDRRPSHRMIGRGASRSADRLGALGGLTCLRGPSDGEEPVGKFVGEAVESAAGDRDGLEVYPQAVPDLGFGESP
jgi:hypothetical protein